MKPSRTTLRYEIVVNRAERPKSQCALRGPGESYSDVILRQAEGEHLPRAAKRKPRAVGGTGAGRDALHVPGESSATRDFAALCGWRDGHGNPG
jgi:hypothetical protein